MPLTTTASWPDLVAGKKAKASEVEAKFDWLEGDLWPMASGATADLTYNLGASGKQWKQAWVGGLNPTSTAAGVAIGKELAGSSTCLDMSAMPKAMLLPIVTTAQQTALTATAGMLVYNSTNARMERYEGGQWLPMANYYGFLSVTFSASTGAYATALSVTGSGRLLNIFASSLAGAGGTTSVSLVPTIDSVVYGTSATQPFGNVTCASFEPGLVNISSSVLWVPTYGGGSMTAANSISQSFKTSISISAKSSITSCTLRFDYEVV